MIKSNSTCKGTKNIQYMQGFQQNDFIPLRVVQQTLSLVLREYVAK